MASVLSTVLSRLNAFLDTELEQTICFDSPIDAESFASKKSAIFLVLPEEDQTKNFMAGLMIQNLSRELFSVADENGDKLKNRVVLSCDEFGAMPPFDVQNGSLHCAVHVQRRAVPEADHAPHHPVPGPVREELRQRGLGDYPR